MQTSVHPSKAKQARAKLTCNTRHHYVWRGYRCRDTTKHIRWSKRMNAILPCVPKHTHDIFMLERS